LTSVDSVGTLVVEDFKQPELIMATVSFSVPDDVKKAFDRAFKSQHKRAVIADLMLRAVAEAQMRTLRAASFRALTDGRSLRTWKDRAPRKLGSAAGPTARIWLVSTRCSNAPDRHSRCRGGAHRG
jgi:hypothetical protein